MASAAAVVNTLRHVTDRKLQKVSEQQSHYESKRAALLKDVEQKKLPAEKLESMIKAIKNLNFSVERGQLSLKNMEMFLTQSRHDSSVPPSLLERWQKDLEHELEVESVRYGFASLFGRLVTEWLQNPNDGAKLLTEPEEEGSDADSDKASSASFLEVGREEMYKQRKEWSSYTFTERQVDQTAIDNYLRQFFDSTLKSKKIIDTPIKALQKSISTFKPIDVPGFDVNILKKCIRGVLKADLFTGRKREALVELLEKPLVLKEMTDVMKMDLAAIDTWDWKEPVSIFQRRQLNGKYRFYMDEEIHDALLLHYVGVSWAVHLKDTFKSFYHSGAWLTSTGNGMSKKYRARREFFLGDEPTATRGSARTRGRGGARSGWSGTSRTTMEGKSVRDVRRKMYQEDYFMTQLPDVIDEHSREYNESEAADSWDEPTAEIKSPTEIKQTLLRLVTTEMLLNTKIYGEFTVLQTDFKWFGPSLPHDTIFAVLKFFGVTGKWLTFFRKFLQTPLVFASDGPDGASSRRKCGVPMSHVLCDALSESVLFALDFVVNQKTGGGNLYRFHDDLWFWGQEKSCVEAWEAIQEFTSVMGLQLNEEKTAAALILKDKGSRKMSASLPNGKVKWGFLVLDPAEQKWVIDKKQVDEHIVELRRQLGACGSLFAWVQAWNSYVTRFLSTNFGQPANCFGRPHVDMVIDTFKHIQRSLFESNGSSVTDVPSFLRKELKARFDIDDVPDGFFYFPIALGGLEIRNPLIPLLAIHAKSFKDPAERLVRAFETEEEDYNKAKKRYEDSDSTVGDDIFTRNRTFSSAAWTPENPADEPFFSMDEYTAFREETSGPLLEAFTNLMETPPEENVQACGGIVDLVYGLSTLGSGEKAAGWGATWSELSPYWKWVVMLYEAEVRKKVGGLELCERGLLPLGLVGLLKGERVRWLG